MDFNKSLTAQNCKPRHPDTFPEVVRLFVGLPILSSMFRPLGHLQSRLGAMPGGGAIRWTPPDQMHLTLRFLGNVRTEGLPEIRQLLKRACHGVGQFDLELKGLGCFPHVRQARVVWLGISGSMGALGDLQRSVANALVNLGDHQEVKPFRPHLTIGRVRARRDDERRVGALVAGTAAVELGHWPVREVVLIRSELCPAGSRHTRMETVLLASR